MAFDVERISAAMRALLVQCPGFIDGAALTDFCDAMSEAIVGELDAGGAGGVDLSGGSFVTWQADGSLSNEKVLAAGTGITVTDATVSLANTAVSAGAYTNASITVDAQGRLTAASSGTGGAPADAQYVVAALNAGLSNELKLTATTGVTVSIGPSDIFVGLTSGVISAGTKTVIGSGTVTVDTYGRVTGVASYTKPTVNYYGNEGSDLSHCGATLLDLIDKLVTAGVINKNQLAV